MVGITLSPEQIRSAPVEVRHWLENQVAISLGLRAEPNAALARADQLIALSVDEAAAMLPLIENMLPAVSVFFELGRASGGVGHDGIEVIRMSDLMRHTRLGTAEQLVACLRTINEAARYVRRAPDADLCLLDPRGYCLIATETQRNIFSLWQQIVARHDGQGARDARIGPAMENAQPHLPFSVSAPIPPGAIHMGNEGPASPLWNADRSVNDEEPARGPML
jgi:hypothetical protein